MVERGEYIRLERGTGADVTPTEWTGRVGGNVYHVVQNSQVKDSCSG